MHVLIGFLKAGRKLEAWLRTRRARLEFAQNAIVGGYFSCGPYARCINGGSNRGNIVIGDHVEILGQIMTEDSGKIKVGNYTTIRGNSRIGAVDSISIGHRVIVSSDVIIYHSNNHPTSVSRREEMLESGFYGPFWQWKNSRLAPVEIGNHIWIGKRAIILKGVRIADGSIVGMGLWLQRMFHPAPSQSATQRRSTKGKLMTSAEG